MSLTIYQLKPHFQRLLSPLLRGLVKLGITPNQVTVLAALLSVCYGAALALAGEVRALWLGLPAFLLLRMALNAIDGMLAKATAQTTPLGAMLNEMGDQVSDLALYLPFALVASVSAPLLVGVVVAALLAEFAGLLALAVGTTRRFDGPMGKSDRAFAFSILALMLAYDTPAELINAILALVLALSLLTVLNRLRRALRLSAQATP